MLWMFWITTTCTTSTCSPSSFFFLFKLVFAVLAVYLYIACQCRGIGQTRHLTSHTVPPPLFTFHGSVSLGLLLFSTSRIKAKKKMEWPRGIKVHYSCLEHESEVGEEFAFLHFFCLGVRWWERWGQWEHYGLSLKLCGRLIRVMKQDSSLCVRTVGAQTLWMAHIVSHCVGTSGFTGT